MGSHFEIIRYEVAHREQVLRLQQHLWGHDAARNRAYFKWKYEANPYLHEPAICVAMHRGVVVGMRGITGARWQFGTSGPMHVIPFTDDFVIAPDYRDQGLAPALIRAACAYAADLGHPYLLSLRAGPVNLLASLAAGYRGIGAMEPVGLVTDRRPRSHQVQRWLQGKRLFWRFSDSPLLISRSDRRPFRHLDLYDPSPEHQGRLHVRIERTPAPEAMAALAERLPADDRIRHVRDREFFSWVFRNPRLEYRFLYWGHDRLDGYLVLQRQLPQLPGPVSVWISDWAGTRDAIQRDLLEVAISGRFDRIATWTATHPDSAKVLLDELGFLPTELEARARGRPAALIRPAREEDLGREWALEGRQLTDLGNWSFRLLDQD